jgi:hypothetical protein
MGDHSFTSYTDPGAMPTGVWMTIAIVLIIVFVVGALVSR